MDYRIAVATYERPKLFYENTLNLLLINDIDLNRLDVFLENEEQLKKYKPICGNLNYIITNTFGICEKRNFVRHNYTFEKYSKYVVQIVDDIKMIWTKNDMP